MQPSAFRDLLVGLFVLAGMAAIAYLSLQVGGLSYKGEGGLEIVAYFDDIGGLTDRAPVSIAGVTVGSVKRIELDEYMRARVVMDFDSERRCKSMLRYISSTSSVLRSRSSCV